MRAFIVFLTLAAALTIPNPSQADRHAGKENMEKAEPKFYSEACFGDRYETDNDINEGNRITEEEILRLINRPSS